MTARRKTDPAPATTTRPALSALLVAPNVGLWTDIILGRQTGTIRTGRRDYAPGVVMLCCPWASACVQAEIVAVRHCSFKDLTAAERRAAGFNGGKAAALAGMRLHYPELTMESDVTFIGWKGVQGTLVERRLLMMAKSDVADDPILDRLD